MEKLSEGTSPSCYTAEERTACDCSLTTSENIADISKSEKAIEDLFFVLNSALNSALESRNRIVFEFFSFLQKNLFP